MSNPQGPLSLYTKVQLRDFLRQRGLTVSGSKDELIDRLRKNLNQQQNSELTLQRHDSINELLQKLSSQTNGNKDELIECLGKVLKQEQAQKIKHEPQQKKKEQQKSVASKNTQNKQEVTMLSISQLDDCKVSELKNFLRARSESTSGNKDELVKKVRKILNEENQEINKLRGLNCDELRSLLRSRNLSPSGNKDELIERLRKAIKEENKNKTKNQSQKNKANGNKDTKSLTTKKKVFKISEINEYNKNELKDFLRERHLPTSGNKDELRERLKNAVNTTKEPTGNKAKTEKKSTTINQNSITSISENIHTATNNNSNNTNIVIVGDGNTNAVEQALAIGNKGGKKSGIKRARNAIDDGEEDQYEPNAKRPRLIRTEMKDEEEDKYVPNGNKNEFMGCLGTGIKEEKAQKKKNEPQKKKKKQQKDPNAPKKPSSSYFLFLNEKRPMIRKQHPNMSMPDITKILSFQWSNTMTTTEKQIYVNRAEKLKKEYEIKMAKYLNQKTKSESTTKTNSVKNISDFMDRWIKESKQEEMKQEPVQKKKQQQQNCASMRNIAQNITTIEQNSITSISENIHTATNNNSNNTNITIIGDVNPLAIEQALSMGNKAGKESGDKYQPNAKKLRLTETEMKDEEDHKYAPNGNKNELIGCLGTGTKEKEKAQKKKNGAQKKKKEKQKDPNAPKKPPSSCFILFLNEKRPMIMKQHPNMSFQDITKILRFQWENTMTTTEKQIYKNEVEKLQKEYEIEMRKYLNEKTKFVKNISDNIGSVSVDRLDDYKVSELKDILRARSKSTSGNKDALVERLKKILMEEKEEMDRLNGLNCDQLRSFLRARNLSPSGNKTELIERLIKAINEENKNKTKNQTQKNKVNGNKESRKRLETAEKSKEEPTGNKIKKVKESTTINDSSMTSISQNIHTATNKNSNNTNIIIIGDGNPYPCAVEQALTIGNKNANKAKKEREFVTEIVDKHEPNGPKPWAKAIKPEQGETKKQQEIYSKLSGLNCDELRVLLRSKGLSPTGNKEELIQCLIKAIKEGIDNETKNQTHKIIEPQNKVNNNENTTNPTPLATEKKAFKISQLNDYKKDELKNFLRDRGLTTSGNKDELRERLKNALKPNNERTENKSKKVQKSTSINKNSMTSISQNIHTASNKNSNNTNIFIMGDGNANTIKQALAIGNKQGNTAGRNAIDQVAEDKYAPNGNKHELIECIGTGTKEQVQKKQDETQKKKKKKKKEQQKDPNAPKKPPSSYFLFLNERRPMIRKQYPNMSMPDIAKQLSFQWNCSMTTTEKQIYVNMAETLKTEYEIEMKNYTESLNQKKKSEITTNTKSVKKSSDYMGPVNIDQLDAYKVARLKDFLRARSKSTSGDKDKLVKRLKKILMEEQEINKLNALNCDQLRSLLRSRNLSPSGNKPELIERIVKAMKEENKNKTKNQTQKNKVNDNKDTKKKTFKISELNEYHRKELKHFLRERGLSTSGHKDELRERLKNAMQLEMVPTGNKTEKVKESTAINQNAITSLSQNMHTATNNNSNNIHITIIGDVNPATIGQALAIGNNAGKEGGNKKGTKRGWDSIEHGDENEYEPNAKKLRTK